MTECPDCKSNSVQSKGYRTKGVHRYICNNCGRNFTVDNRENTQPEKIKTEGNGNKKTTVALDREIVVWLESLKLIPQEPLNAVLMRIKEEKEKEGVK